MYRNTEDNECILDGERAHVTDGTWEHMPDTVWLDGMVELGAVPAAMLDDRRWNGWACPWFTREHAETIVNASNALNAEWGGDAATPFRWDGAALLEGYYDYEHGNRLEWAPVATIERDGVTLYGIGNDGWCWVVGAPDADD